MEKTIKLVGVSNNSIENRKKRLREQFISDVKSYLKTFNVPKKTPIFRFFNLYYTFNNSHMIDYEWMEEQIDYIDTLTEKQKYILYSYSYKGDYLINNYLRNYRYSKKNIQDLLLDSIKSEFFPFYYQYIELIGKTNDSKNLFKKNILQKLSVNDIKYIIDNIELLMDKYIDELKLIILNSPKTKKDMFLFRGIKNDNFISELTYLNTNDNKDKIYFNEFLSTSINLSIAASDQFSNSYCCILKMIIPQNSNCLFFAPLSKKKLELEVLLPNNLTFQISSSYRSKIITEDKEYENYEKFLDYTNSENSYKIKRVRQLLLTT